MNELWSFELLIRSSLVLKTPVAVNQPNEMGRFEELSPQFPLSFAITVIYGKGFAALRKSSEQNITTLPSIQQTLNKWYF